MAAPVVSRSMRAAAPLARAGQGAAHRLPPRAIRQPRSHDGWCAVGDVGLATLQGLPREARGMEGRRFRCACASVSSFQGGGVSTRMKQIASDGKCALIPFVVAGDPDLALLPRVLQALDANGADVIELGVPYSDPLADGPTIQAAASRALEKKVTLNDVLVELKKSSGGIKAPIVLFTYYNPILNMGLETFCARATDAGAKGLLVPDLPIEETQEIRSACEAAGLDLILLVTPTTPVERMRRIASASSGFVYLVSLAGVTGARAQVASNVESLLKDLKDCTDSPVAVGFGVSSPDQAALIKSWGADGVIVGSAMVSALNAEGDAVANLTELTASLRAALD